MSLLPALLVLLAVQQPPPPAAPPAPPAPPAPQAPPPVQADSGRPCRVAIDSVGRLGRQQEVVPARPGSKAIYNYYGGGGVWAHCEGTSSRLTADSIAWYGQELRLDMVGHVQIRDATMELDATTARYYTPAERLEAHREVVAVNRGNGTVLRGPNLTYLRAVPGLRDTSELVATSRPTIHYRGSADSTEPYVIVADRVRMRGDDRMWAGGHVTIDRSDIAARSDSMSLDQGGGSGLLVGAPRLEGKGERAFSLVGIRIELELDSSEVRLVKALQQAEATGEDWRLTADTIHLALTDRKLQQTFAWGDSLRPRAVSTQHTIQADSVALDTPEEVLTELRAFGRALSTSKREHGSAADLDWIAGDTLIAHFEQVEDSAAGRTSAQLRELTARGSARALTHLYEEADSTGGPDINYSRGTSIAIKLDGDRVDEVLVAGKADGVHLERRPPAPADSITATTRNSSPAPPRSNPPR